MPMLPPSNPHGSQYILPLYLSPHPWQALQCPSQCSHTAFTCLLILVAQLCLAHKHRGPFTTSCSWPRSCIAGTAQQHMSWPATCQHYKKHDLLQPTFSKGSLKMLETNTNKLGRSSSPCYLKHFC